MTKLCVLRQFCIRRRGVQSRACPARLKKNASAHRILGIADRYFLRYPWVHALPCSSIKLPYEIDKQRTSYRGAIGWIRLFPGPRSSQHSRVILLHLAHRNTLTAGYRAVFGKLPRCRICSPQTSQLRIAAASSEWATAVMEANGLSKNRKGRFKVKLFYESK